MGQDIDQGASGKTGLAKPAAKFCHGRKRNNKGTTVYFGYQFLVNG